VADRPSRSGVRGASHPRARRALGERHAIPQSATEPWRRHPRCTTCRGHRRRPRARAPQRPPVRGSEPGARPPDEPTVVGRVARRASDAAPRLPPGARDRRATARGARSCRHRPRRESHRPRAARYDPRRSCDTDLQRDECRDAELRRGALRRGRTPGPRCRRVRRPSGTATAGVRPRGRARPPDGAAGAARGRDRGSLPHRREGPLDLARGRGRCPTGHRDRNGAGAAGHRAGRRPHR